ncbi:pinensin family lanthipeptide [Longimicrobium sp.]|uniref:pinensin family lanthipeptide n=1 Tax=Longimicrobium sp. TaxID=2029185 RepID=UPI002CCE116B|nr:pinensin family lanthipeptide [Longimicrobium sp.]HSU15396.1 pinensin family lanthipeptide [Longimicrobium sp.]
MKVKLEEIRVDSFVTSAEPVDGRGTVRAFEASLLLTCHLSCPPKYTCPECAPPVMPERERED